MLCFWRGQIGHIIRMGHPFVDEDVGYHARLTEFDVGANGGAQEQVARPRYQKCGRETVEVPIQGRDQRILQIATCLLYTSPSPRDRQKSRMPSSA